MSNLASMIMGGATYGIKANLKHKYGHEDGAGLIAMESAEALRDIFEAEFYVPNTCTIAATLEGFSCVEESAQQSAIMEASFKGAFEKIKQFFIDLKDKVKEFLHNIKRYLTGIFGNDEKWVKAYEKEIMAISSSDLKDYEVKMYNYTFGKALDSSALSAAIDEGVKNTQDEINKELHEVNDQELDDDELDAKYDKSYDEFIKELVGGKSIDADELDKALWSMMRNGADDESDKEEVKVAGNRKTYIDALKNASKELSSWDKMISETDKRYKKCLDVINKAEKAADNAKENDKGNRTINYQGDGYMSGKKSNIKTKELSSTATSNYTTILRKLASYTSKCQTATNKKNTAAKSALVERNKAYKAALTGVFSYARKNKGGK